jgi:S-DNA-T family DNA segregation ATPase FtsK/SpoIIIE
MNDTQGTVFQRIFSGRKWWRDVAGLLLSTLGIITLITLLGWNAGGIISAWADFLRHAFGIGVFVFCIILIGMGVPLLLNTPIRIDAERLIQIIAGELAFFALLALIHSLTFGADSYALIQAGSGGGAVGWVLSRLIWLLLGSEEGFARFISIAIWFVLLVISATVAFRPLLQVVPREEEDIPAFSTRTAVHDEGELAPPIKPRPTRAARMVEPEPLIIEPPPAKPVEAEPPKPEPKPITIKSHPTIIRSDAPKPMPAGKKAKTPLPHDDTLPPVTLLKAMKEAKNNDADVKRQADIIETTLAQFGLAGQVVEVRRGPTVTQFGIEPGYLERSGPNGEKRKQKVRVSQIASLQNDFALALSASSIRIEAPIPGKSQVGIEVPNIGVGTVDLRGVMENEAFLQMSAKSPLAIALGRDVSGTPITADLGRMPHLLIAGTTGSGKSVCISTIAVCLCMNNRPENLKLVLIDPKMVELSRFTGLPHIIGKPESELERIPGVLRWVTKEMDARYKQFAEVGARNLADYNESAQRRGEETLPRIVVLIDELADLMLQSPIETEKTICRLAQMARATGIHLVVATQRPSVDVVTGLIKANFPARISFAVASSMDSRVILDQVGAESLLGRGDMLFLNPEAGHPTRLQGCFVSDKEVEVLISWWKKEIENEQEKRKPRASAPAAEEEAYVANRKPELETPWETTVAEMAAERLLNGRGGSSGNGGDDENNDDELVKRALDIIKNTGKVSTSLLQRKLRIGYPRAARLMEELQEMGYVGAASRQAGKGRDVNRDLDEEE